jgi:hypothetical protein
MRAAIARHGRHDSASASISLALGRDGSANASFAASCNARSPAGHASA